MTSASPDIRAGNGPAADRYQVFDAARCVAAVCVLAGHARNLFMQDYSPASPAWIKAFQFVTGFGHQAVIVFFVLSGYWITRTIVERNAAGRWTWTGYGADRLSRLWVVLIPALIVGGLFDAVSSRAAQFAWTDLGSNILQPDYAAHIGPVVFLGNTLFVQTLLTPTFGSNGPLWSLANEFWYYLWFPALYGLARRRWTPLPLLAALASLIAFHALLPGFACWLCGSALYYLARHRQAPGWALLPALAALLAILAASRLKLPLAGDFPIAAATAVFFWAAVGTRHAVLAPLAVFGRRASYSLYLCHLPALVLVAALTLHGVRIQDPAAGAAVVLGLVAAAVAYGWGFSLATERHTPTVRRWMSALARRLRTVAAGPSRGAAEGKPGA